MATRMQLMKEMLKSHSIPQKQILEQVAKKRPKNKLEDSLVWNLDVDSLDDRVLSLEIYEEPGALVEYRSNRLRRENTSVIRLPEES